jgi:cell division protein ZapA
MTAKAKTMDVTIMGRSYKVACTDEERESLLAAVDYLDAKMNEIKDAGRVASAERIAVMAALNVSHELLSSRQDAGAPVSFDIDSAKRKMNLMQSMLDEVLDAEGKLL